MKLDRIDFEILGILQQNARISNKELAEANGISPSTCLERVRRLRSAGVIEGYHADVDPSFFGIAVQAMISIRLRQHAEIDFDKMIKEMSLTKEVVNVYLLAGGNDFMVHVAVRDVDHLRSVVVDNFTARYEVAHIETALIFEYVKAAVLPNYQGAVNRVLNSCRVTQCCDDIASMTGDHAMTEVVLTAAVRTPIGSFQGSLSTVPAVDLGAAAIREVVKRAGVDGADVDEVLMGMVLSAGAGQAPARQAALGAGLPNSVPCTTVNKVCGSGLKTVMLAQQAIANGDITVAVAGGMESMSLAPYLLPNARSGYRMGPGTIVDAMIHDGLWDPFGDSSMGNYGDLCASEKNFSREAQDGYSIRSYERAIAAREAGQFNDEIIPIDVTVRKKTQSVSQDEEPGRFLPEKIPNLRPAFSPEGTVTAANASKISDGAAAVTLMSKQEAEKRDSPILARIVASASFAQQPKWFTTAPVQAIQMALKKAGLQVSDIDLFEINEAFAVVAMAAIQELKLAEQQVNVRGGAISLGHPIGCSGTRILVTLLHTMRQQNKRYGCASLCIGGGEAVAMIVENVDP